MPETGYLPNLLTREEEVDYPELKDLRSLGVEAFSDEGLCLFCGHEYKTPYHGMLLRWDDEKDKLVVESLHCHLCGSPDNPTTCWVAKSKEEGG